ncbi:hypothetical protein [Rhizomonospora bruguierae]|uniref:hypothetical protein n=1 Tax=Rhizomonospora bruguierae TaxID=1581705 RepID=UPI001BCF7089|nr:hypothetical protein [Micromonospora sp. NBRC 107566]
MGLNTAGLNALLDQGRAATIWVAVGSGTGAGNQTSNERIQATWNPASGAVLTASGTPFQFTGDPEAAATHVLLFSAQTSGTFLGFVPLAGDQAFNAAGSYEATSLTITGTSPA